MYRFFSHDDFLWDTFPATETGWLVETRQNTVIPWKFAELVPQKNMKWSSKIRLFPIGFPFYMCGNFTGPHPAVQPHHSCGKPQGGRSQDSLEGHRKHRAEHVWEAQRKDWGTRPVFSLGWRGKKYWKGCIKNGPVVFVCFVVCLFVCLVLCFLSGLLLGGCLIRQHFPWTVKLPGGVFVRC